MHSLISAGTAARAARASPLPARRRAAARGLTRAGLPVRIDARPRRSVSNPRSPGTQAGYPARASPPAESSSLCGAARVWMRHACSLLIAHCSSGGSLKLRHVLALAQRLLACGSPGPTLPLGPERTASVRSTSSGSVGGAAPYVHHQVAVWAALPLGPRRTVRTATRARAYRLGTFNVEWQCESHCHSGLSVQPRAGGAATRP